MKSALFQIPEKPAEAASLKELQIDISKQQIIFDKFTKKKNELEEELKKRNRLCYKSQLHQLYLFECAKNLSEKDKAKPITKLLCANEKEFLGAAYIYMQKVVYALKENYDFFGFLVQCINQQKDISEENLEKLSDELIFLFFPDFGAGIKFNHSFLKHINYLLPELFKECKISKKLYPFDNLCFTNKLLKSYMKRSEIKNYTKLLFSKTLNRMLEISTRPQKNNDFSTPKRATMLEKTEFSPKEFKNFSIGSENVLKNQAKTDDLLQDAVPDNVLIEGMSSEELCEICDEMIENIFKQIVYFPIEIRILFKLIEKHAIENFVSEGENSAIVVKKLILDFIFYKWWLTALMKPQENELIEICTTDAKFSKKVVYILKIMKAIFYSSNEAISDKPILIPAVISYIKSKENISDKYIYELLNISNNFQIENYLENTENLEKSVNITNLCMSLKSIELIHNLLNKNISDLSKFKDVYAKCVGHLQFLLEQRPKDQGSLFIPNPATFKPEKIEENTGFNIAHSDCFILFESIKIKDPMKKELFSEKWQQMLHKLLLEVDLMQNYDFTLAKSAENKNEIVQIMCEINKHPAGFVIRKDLETKVSLLAQYLVEIFENMGEEIIPDSINDLKIRCEQNIEDFVNQCKNTEYLLRDAINSMGNRLSILKQINNKYAIKTISGIVANRIIKDFIIPFKIFNEKSPSGPLTAKNASKLSSIPVHYTILLTEKRKAGVVPGSGITGSGIDMSSLSLKMFVGSSKKAPGTLIAEGDNIKDFVDCFSVLRDLSYLVIDNKDENGTGTVFRLFMENLRKMLMADQKNELYGFFAQNIEKVLEEIGNYCMSRIFSLVYPIIPTESDRCFNRKINELQNTDTPELLIQPDTIPCELLNLAISILKESEIAITPHQKVECYERCYKLISEGLEIVSSNQKIQIPYDSTQILTFSILRANLSRIISDINYIEWFRICCKDHIKTKCDCCFCKIKSAVSFLRNLKVVPKMLPK